MKNKTIGIAATTGLFGVAIGALVSPPTLSVAQQKTSDYATPTAPPTALPSATQQKPQCPQGGPSNVSSNASQGRLRDVSFDGPPPPRSGFGGPGGGPGGGWDGGPRGGGPGGHEGGRPPGPPQDNGAPSEDGHAHGPMLNEIIDQLNLSDAQKEKVTKMLDFEREKMEALHEQQVKVQTQTRTNVEAVLTAEQKQQLTKMETQMSVSNDGPPPGGRHPGGRGGGPGGGFGGPGGRDGERGGPRGGGRGGR